MACPCGSDRFIAKQQVYVEIIVDSTGYYQENRYGSLEQSVLEAGKPYGPYVCIFIDSYTGGCQNV